jgi:hypothetical protein
VNWTLASGCKSYLLTFYILNGNIFTFIVCYSWYRIFDLALWYYKQSYQSSLLCQIQTIQSYSLRGESANRIFTHSCTCSQWEEWEVFDCKDQDFTHHQENVQGPCRRRVWGVHIQVHKTIMADCNVKEETMTARSLILTNKREIVALSVVDPAANQVEIENLVKIIVNSQRRFTPYKKTCLTTLRRSFHQPWPWTYSWSWRSK